MKAPAIKDFTRLVIFENSVKVAYYSFDGV